jgi:hypothetical protein
VKVEHQTLLLHRFSHSASYRPALTMVGAMMKEDF